MRTPPRIARAALAVALAAAAVAAPGCDVRRTWPTRPGTVVVYGATSSGVVAAIAAARDGKSVVLLEPTTHVGGMTTGGLGETDVGAAVTIGGIAREFYRRVGAAYGRGVAFEFEPRVAGKVMKRMLDEAGVRLVTGAPAASVTRNGPALTALVTEDGTSWPADVFIDASYEGDLLPLAGVSFTIGRESRATYGEPHAGATPAEPDRYRVDPWVVPGDPDSGLLANVSPDPLPAPGTGDDRVQPYNFRLCLTRRPENRIEIGEPDEYDPAQYEVLARRVEAKVAAGRTVTLGEIVRLSQLPGGEYDANNAGYFSTDLIGGSQRWPTATWAERREIQAAHERYARGLLYFLATSPRLPPAVRAAASSLGLCRDEFTETGGWPPQLYVREARRMIGAYVVTERDAHRQTDVRDPIGLASYDLDCHPIQRLVVDGSVRREGGLWVGLRGPFPIPYRALTPRASEATNLLVSAAVSASHVAFASIRMEPVFMIMGHSAGAAAALAIDRGTTVQQVDAQELMGRLQLEDQIISR